MTTATVLAFLVIRLFFPATSDVTGPLTALLVVQASSAGTLRMAGLRVMAVITGILISLAVATYVGLTWWSLGLVVALALLVAKVLRLGDQLLETPISAMLILGASATETAAETRLLYTLVGASVGIGLSLLFPPSLPMAMAASRVRQVSDQLAEQLSAAGETLAGSQVSRTTIDTWIAELRSVGQHVDTASEAIDRISEIRRLNTRAIVAHDVAPLLRTGLATLENCWLAVRALFIQIRNEVPDEGSTARPDDDLRAVFAVVLHHSSAAIRGFGELVEAEAEGRQDEAVFSFAVSLEMLREAQAILTELMLTDSGSQSWLLRGSTLSAVEQMLAQLDLDSRSQVRSEWERAQADRFGAHLPVLVRDALPHPERPLPSLVERGLRQVLNRRRGAQLVNASVRLAAGVRRLFADRPEHDRATQEWVRSWERSTGTPWPGATSPPVAPRDAPTTRPGQPELGPATGPTFSRRDLDSRTTGPQATED